MSNGKKIYEIADTATEFAADDYIAVAGETNGTRKILRTAVDVPTHNSDAAAHVLTPQKSPPKVVFIGDSLTSGQNPSYPNRYSPTSWANRAAIKCGGRWRMHKNSGVDSNTTPQMLARWDADVAAYSPNVVVIMGGTNDALNANWGTTYTAATICSNILAMIRLSRKIGALPVVLGIPPLDGGSVTGRPELINAALSSMCAIEGVPFSAAIHDAVVVSGATTFVSAYTSDGIHLTELGADVAAEAAESAIAQYIGLTKAQILPVNSIDPTSLAPNPLFTDSNADGKPDLWSVGTEPGITHSIHAGEVGNWWRVTSTGAAASVSLLTTAPPTEGARVAICFRVRHYSVDESLRFQIYYQFDGVSEENIRPLFVSAPATIPLDGVWWFEGVVPSGLTGGTVVLYVAAGSGYVEISQLGVFQLD